MYVPLISSYFSSRDLIDTDLDRPDEPTSQERLSRAYAIHAGHGWSDRIGLRRAPSLWEHQSHAWESARDEDPVGGLQAAQPSSRGVRLSKGQTGSPKNRKSSFGRSRAQGEDDAVRRVSAQEQDRRACATWKGRIRAARPDGHRYKLPAVQGGREPLPRNLHRVTPEGPTPSRRCSSARSRQRPARPAARAPHP